MRMFQSFHRLYLGDQILLSVEVFGGTMDSFPRKHFKAEFAENRIDSTISSLTKIFVVLDLKIQHQYRTQVVVCFGVAKIAV